MAVTGLAELKRNLNTFKRKARNVIEDAVYEGATMIANEARQDHGADAHAKKRYKDITTNLTQSIQEQKPKVRGSKITSDVTAGDVTAGMEYAAKVEQFYPFLFPALEKMSRPINREIMKLLRKIRWIN